MFPATKLAGLTKDVRERQSLTLQPQRSEKDDSDDSFHVYNCASVVFKIVAAGNGGMNIIKNKIVS